VPRTVQPLAAAALALALLAPACAIARRPIPDTRRGVHVWNDQLPDSMTRAQARFVARHVDGTQKVGRATAEALRRYKRGFLVLHYRLGIGDGPVPFRIGDRWASDYPSVTHHESWFWHSGGKRVRQTQWDWYLMNPDSGWRAYWARRVIREARLLGDDGVFADSLSVPHYLGADSFDPPFTYFKGEAAWTRRVNRFMRYERRRLRHRLWFVPNAGSWITTRDRTDYTIPDGVMIEGFAESSADSHYAPVDWRLQMDRVLRLARKRRIVIAQSYLGAGDSRARGFVFASYLLTKGRRSFANMSIGTVPQWFPEYGVRLGAARKALPKRIDALRRSGGLYARRYARGLAVANPDGSPHRLRLSRPMRLVVPHGGGELGASASTRGWRLTTRRVTGTLTLPAFSGAVLLNPR
jgi:Hypothetical glycosyl hydrolase family 15